MKTNVKVIINSLVTFIVLATILSACMTTGNRDMTGNDGDNDNNKDPIELVFYSRSGDFDTEGFMEMFGNKIKEKFPYITPKFAPYKGDSTMENLVTTGETLDILYYSVGQSWELLDYELEYDISELIKQQNYDLNRLEPTTVEIQRQLANGKIYGLPVFNNTVTLFYNREIFDKFGTDYPKDGLTWDELYDLARVMSRSDGTLMYQGITISLGHNMLINQLSIPYTDQENRVDFTTDAFKKLFTVWTRFYQLPGNELDQTTINYGVQVNRFDKDKRIAMFLGLAALGPARFKDNLDWDVASYPVFDEIPDVGPQPYPTFFYISKTSRHKKEAFDVIAYLTSNEFQEHLSRNGFFPILRNREAMSEYGKEVPFLAGKNIDGFMPSKFASPAKTSEFQTEGTSALTGAFRSVLLKVKDINTALRDATEEANSDIAAELVFKQR